MSLEENSQRFLNEAEAQKRKLMRSLKIMGVSWPLMVILTLYVRYAEEGATSTHIVTLILLVCFLVALWSVFSVIHEWRLYRHESAKAGIPDRHDL